MTVFGTALAWALATAAVHVAVVLVRVHLVRGFTLTADLFVLAAPVTYSLLFVALAVPLCIAARVWPRHVTEARIVGFYAGVAVLSILLLYREVHPLSWLVVAVGTGWQASSWVAVRPRPMRTMRRRVAPALALILVVIGGGPLVWGWALESLAIRSGRRAADGAPNVLLLILDTVRARNLSLYGHDRATSPAIDRIGAEGLVFDQAFSTASWSLPSHASLLTGVWAHETGGSYLRRVHDSLPTVAEVLRDRGYLAAAFMANGGWAGHESGLTRGFHRYLTYRRDLSQVMWSSSLTQTTLGRELIRGTVAADVPRILKALIRFDLRAGEAMTANLRSGPEIVEAFSTWRDRIGDRHPWFVTLNLFDAHAPYRTPYEYRFNDGERRIDRYDGAIAWVDEMVGRIVEILRTRGELDRTLVIVTSDHGEFFGEHGLVDHGRPPYLPVVHVPLVMRYPPRLTPARHATPVTNADVPATILDVVGAPGGMLPGRSLAGSAATDTTSLVLFLANRLINADTSRRASRGRFLGALTEQWHLIRGPDGSEELYRWRVDSLETENLAGLPEVAADQAALGALLRAPSSRRTVR